MTKTNPASSEAVLYAADGMQLFRTLGSGDRPVTVVQLSTEAAPLRDRFAATVERVQHEPVAGMSYISADLAAPTPWAASVDEPGRLGVERILPDLVGEHAATQAATEASSARAADGIYATVADVPRRRRRWHLVVAVLLGLLPSAVVLAMAWSAGGGEEPMTEHRPIQQTYDAPASEAPPPAPFVPAIN